MLQSRSIRKMGLVKPEMLTVMWCQINLSLNQKQQRSCPSTVSSSVKGSNSCFYILSFSPCQRRLQLVQLIFALKNLFQYRPLSFCIGLDTQCLCVHCRCRYLISQGASVGVVNSEGETPLDIAEEEAMEELLQNEINRQGTVLQTS